MGHYTDQLLENVAHWFELADQNFDLEDCPLSMRPLRAAIFTAEFGVERNYDRNIDKYEDLLIGHLLNAARLWYHTRYGKEECRPAEDVVAGVVLFRSIPVALCIPLVMKSLEDNDEHIRVSFLTKFNEAELPTKFLRTELPLNTLDSEERLIFENRIRKTVTLTRAICTSVRMVVLAEKTHREMCHSVAERINLGGSLLQQGSSIVRAMSIWEFFFAIELLLKTFIIQQGGIPQRVHVLEDLRRSARNHGLQASLVRLSDLPSSGYAIQHRYAQKGATVLEAMEIYSAALEIAAEIVSELKLCINADNPAILLKRKPGWIFPPA